MNLLPQIFSGSVKTYKNGNVEEIDIKSLIALMNIKDKHNHICFFLFGLNICQTLLGKLYIDTLLELNMSSFREIFSLSLFINSYRHNLG